MLDKLKRYFLLSHMTYKSKYADSFIGVIWIPLSSLFLIAVLTLIFRSSPDLDFWSYTAYISLGYITWGFVSESLNGHCDVFRAKRTDLNSPGVKVYEVFLKALVDRTYIFLLNLVFLSFLFFGGIIWDPIRLLVFIGGLVALFVASFLVTYVFSVICLFFPDFKRLISNFTRILFFSSPIFWGYGSQLQGMKQYFYTYNPVTYFLEIIRYGLGVKINMSLEYGSGVIFLIIGFLILLSLLLSKITPSYLKNIQ